jgi:late competence protein required for DNA uptake (superfamily II DNA/RNA helicase)
LQCTVVPLQYLKCYLNVIVKSKHHMQSIVKPRNVHSFTCHRHFFKRMIITRVIEILEKMVLQNLQYIVYVHSIWGLLFHSKYFILN